MSLTSRLLGGTMGFAHLAGIVGPAGKKAKSRAEDDEKDKTDASDDDDQDDPPAKGKKAKKAKAKGQGDDEGDKTDDDDDDDRSASAGDDDDDDDEENRAAADDDDDDEEEQPSRGKKAKGARSQAALSDYKRGRQAERKRCAAIFGSQHAAKNIPQAAELAFNTTLSAEAAIGILKTAGPGGSNSGSRSRVNPDLGADGDEQARRGGGASGSWSRSFAKAGVKPAGDAGRGLGDSMRRASR